MFHALKRYQFGESGSEFYTTNQWHVLRTMVDYLRLLNYIVYVVRQGCPMSALLFILCVETLACKIRQNHTTQGFKLSHNGANL